MAGEGGSSRWLDVGTRLSRSSASCVRLTGCSARWPRTTLRGHLAQGPPLALVLGVESHPCAARRNCARALPAEDQGGSVGVSPAGRALGGCGTGLARLIKTCPSSWANTLPSLTCGRERSRGGASAQ